MDPHHGAVLVRVNQNDINKSKECVGSKSVFGLLSQICREHTEPQYGKERNSVALFFLQAVLRGKTYGGSQASAYLHEREPSHKQNGAPHEDQRETARRKSSGIDQLPWCPAVPEG